MILAGNKCTHFGILEIATKLLEKALAGQTRLLGDQLPQTMQTMTRFYDFQTFQIEKIDRIAA